MAVSRMSMVLEFTMFVFCPSDGLCQEIHASLDAKEMGFDK